MGASIELMIALGALVVVALAAIIYAIVRDRSGPPAPRPATSHGKEKVHAPAPSPASGVPPDMTVLLTLPGQSPFRIDKTEYRVGRASRDQSVPTDLNLEPYTGKYGSRKHALIYLDPAMRQWCIRDLGSMNGTFINERQLREGDVHVLKHRDRISFTDRFEVVFEHPGSSDGLPNVPTYRILELVAKGGMAAVYKANAASGDLVAIKVPLDYGEDPKLVSLRLQDEFDLLQRVNSPRSARAVEMARCSDGRPAMVMEFLHGQTLRNFLQKSAIAPTEAIPVGAAIADGLYGLHSLDRIHCDLKPDNVMMRQVAQNAHDIANHAVIIDFGIAMQNRTTMRNVFGSANYQSPEHILGQQLTLKSDVYSLGCMMYEMVANSRLYPDAKEVKDIKEFQVNRMPLNVAEQAAIQGRHVPDGLAKLVMLMLEKSPNVRPDLRQVSDQLNSLKASVFSAGPR